jgi:hypothetical protein
MALLCLLMIRSIDDGTYWTATTGCPPTSAIGNISQIFDACHYPGSTAFQLEPASGIDASRAAGIVCLVTAPAMLLFWIVAWKAICSEGGQASSTNALPADPADNAADNEATPGSGTDATGDHQHDSVEVEVTPLLRDTQTSSDAQQGTGQPNTATAAGPTGAAHPVQDTTSQVENKDAGECRIDIVD